MSGRAKVGRKSIHSPTLLSIVVSALLIAIAVIRIFSYSRTTVLGEIVKNSPLHFVGYEATSYLNTQFLKIIATPSIVAMQYLIFRALNWTHTRNLPDSMNVAHRRLDFRSPGLRFLLTSLITLHWVVIEAVKFSSPQSFYPYSALESRSLNMIVLLCSQLIAFLAMKYLCFEPLFKEAGYSPSERNAT